MLPGVRARGDEHRSRLRLVGAVAFAIVAATVMSACGSSSSSSAPTLPKHSVLFVRLDGHPLTGRSDCVYQQSQQPNYTEQGGFWWFKCDGHDSGLISATIQSVPAITTPECESPSRIASQQLGDAFEQQLSAEGTVTCTLGGYLIELYATSGY